MRKRRICLFALATVLAAALAWFFLPARDPIFHGKPESEWLTNIVYGESKAQVQQWRGFGPEGLRVLERALKPSREYRYRKYYRRYAYKLPRFIVRLLPSPSADKSYSTRMCVLDLLKRMDKDGWPAWRSVARALEDDDDGIRLSAISFFSWREDDSALLNQMAPRDKKAILPHFLRGLEDPDWGIRNNAALALRYYPEERQVVVPALSNALADAEPPVRLVAAESLIRIDPIAASRAGVVKALAALVVHTDDQIAGSAASALRRCRNDADEAVAALLKGLQSTNSYVSSSCVGSLESFPGHADSILPELRRAAERTDHAGGYAKQAVKKLEARQATQRPR
jgi:hypothetical protein